MVIDHLFMATPKTVEYSLLAITMFVEHAEAVICDCLIQVSPGVSTPA